jgi:hypothetical protein
VPGLPRSLKKTNKLAVDLEFVCGLSAFFFLLCVTNWPFTEGGISGLIPRSVHRLSTAYQGGALAMFS